MKKRKKFKGRILTLMLSLAMLLSMIPTYAFAGEIGGMPGARSEYNASTGDVFLGGNYIEVGISKHGSFGTSTLPTTNQNWHPHSSASGLGLTSDGDGWDVGEGPATGDFFLPGSPEERWGFAYKLGGVEYQYLVADRQRVFSGEWSTEPTVKDESDVSKGVLKAVVSGKTIHDVELTITYSFGVDDKFYNTRVEIANKSANEISNVRFLRSFDPDHDQQTQGDFETYNKVICNPISDKAGSSKNFAMVVARGSKTMAGFFFLSFDNRARASRGVSFAPNSLYLSGLWDNAPTTKLTYADENEIALTQGMVDKGEINGYTKEDNAIAITCHIGNIAANTDDSIEFISSLDPNVQEALSGILNAQVDYKNEILTGLEPNGTYEITCDNEKYTLTADNKGEIPLRGEDNEKKQYDFIGKKLTIAKRDSEDAPVEVEVAGRPETPKNPSDLGNEGDSTPALDADIEIVKLTSTFVTISPAEGQQYAYSTDEGKSWTDITDTDNDGNYVVDNLQEGSAVKIRTRVAATSQAPASEWSGPTDVTLMTTVTVSATGWSGIYDKNAHSITVTATNPAEGVTITYSSAADGKYSKTNPSFYTSGEHVVYYRAAAEGYYPDYGSAIVNIDKKEITVSGVRVDKNNTLKKVVFSGLLSGDELANDIDYEVYDFRIDTEADNTTASVKVRLKDTQSANNYKLSVETISNIPVTVEADPTPSRPTVPTENYTVPVKNENTVHVDAQIKDGSAVVSEITPETLNKVAAASTGSGSDVETVTIDLSGAKQEVTGITLSKKSVETLAQAAADKDNSISTVTIEMTKASVVLDADTLKTLAQDANGTDFQLVVEDTEHKNLNTTQQTALKNHQVAATFEAFFVSGGQRIHDFKGGSAVVFVKFTPQAGKDANYYHMVYVSDDGKLTRYKTRYEDGRLFFTTTPFSDYAIIYDETEKNDTEQAQLTDAERIEALKGFKLVARSRMSWLGKDRSVRVNWYDAGGKDLGEFGFNGYEIWRSVKRNTGYGKKPFFVTEKEFYHNDRIKAGKKYYYRVRGFIIVDGKKYYTEWSLKAWRTVPQ